MNIEFLKLQKNDTDIKHILSRILPQLSFLIMLNFGHYANYFAFLGNRKTKKQKTYSISAQNTEDGLVQPARHEENAVKAWATILSAHLGQI
jgi:hypothetical protein